MTLHEALDRVYQHRGCSAEYLLLRQAVRALTPDQVREIEALNEPPKNQPVNPGFCCSTCGQGFDFGCRCPDY